MNMKKINYLLIAILSLAAIACGEIGSDDATPPVISDVRVFVRDTIRYESSPGQWVTITLNDSTKGFTENDEEFLVIGKSVSFKGRFTDDEALSSAYLHIWGDTCQSVPYDEVTDTCYHVRRLLPIYMSGEKEKVVDGLGLRIIERVESTYTRRMSDRDKTLTLQVRESKERGEKDVYKFSVHCSDMKGNLDKVNFKEKPMNIFSRKTIIEKHKKLTK